MGILLRLLKIYDCTIVLSGVLIVGLFAFQTYESGTSVPHNYYQLTAEDVAEHPNLQSIEALPGDYVDDNNKLVRRLDAESFQWQRVDYWDDPFYYLVGYFAGALLLRWLLLGTCKPFS